MSAARAIAAARDGRRRGRLTVPEDFRFNVDGKMLSVRELKPGKAGTATITTKTSRAEEEPAPVMSS
jgi:hypothetical protein